MKKITSLALFSVLMLASLSASAQKPAPSARPTSTPQTVQPADENEVVRITTNLIQVDAVVTDKNGRVVRDLRPEDFEIIVNGKSQKITNFSFVMVEPQPVEQPLIASTSAERAGPLPPVRLRPEQVNRTIALVVDDLTLSFTSSKFVKEALKKFVDEQMQPGDLVAIIRTGSGIGTLQQFTSDKQQLYAAIERMKYNWLVGRLDAFHALGGGPMPQGKMKDSGEGPGIKGRDTGEDFNNDFLVQSSLSATRNIIEGMRGLPGRKAVMLLSEGFSLASDDDFDSAGPSRDKMKLLVDSANRAGVVIYALDARGLVADGLTPSDLDLGMQPSSQQMMASLRINREAFQRPLDGMIHLTEQTGGFTVYNTNDLPGGIRKALDDQKSYYLLGYQPDASTFSEARGRFNRLTVKVKGDGLKVRYRSGFFGIKDEEVKPLARTPQQQIIKALTSPFGAGDINLRLTPLFSNDPRAGSFVRSLVHISTKNLTFSDKPDGSHEAVINVVAYTFGDNGMVVDSVGETHTITLTDNLYQRALSRGLVYSLNVPIKQAGGYQLRVAVRDGKSERVGSASQFIEIPDLKQDRLTLSGIALSSYDPKEDKSRKAGANQQSAGETAGDSVLTQAALRRFRAGHVLRFAYAIYNAKSDKQTRQPQLTTQIRLYHDGKEIYAGKETPYDSNGQVDLERLVAEGALQLGGLQEGEYVLQITAKDLLEKGKYQSTTNWIDFEVVK